MLIEIVIFKDCASIEHDRLLEISPTPGFAKRRYIGGKGKRRSIAYH